jgi:hypothetical protein
MIYKVKLRLNAQPNSIMESVLAIPGITSIFIKYFRMCS